MKQQEIDALKSLDPEGMNGTIQSALMQDNLNEIPFNNMLYQILSTTLKEREYYLKDNQKLMHILMDHGLYNSELLLGDK